MTDAFFAVGPLGLGLGYVRIILIAGGLLVAILIWWSRSRT